MLPIGRRQQRPMVSLSAAEVGDVDKGGYIPSTAFERYRQRHVVAPVASESIRIVCRPTTRRFYPPEMDIATCHFCHRYVGSQDGGPLILLGG